MTPVVTCLAFSSAEQTEQAVHAYVELFREVFGHAGELARTCFSERELDVLRHDHGLPDDQLPGSAGDVKTIRFHLNGVELIALNGGAHFGRFSESMSLSVTCTSQAQIDRLHEALSAGGDVQPCGWVRDRFGVSWQILPELVYATEEGPDRAAAEAMSVAMLSMTKIELDRLPGATP